MHVNCLQIVANKAFFPSTKLNCVVVSLECGAHIMEDGGPRALMEFRLKMYIMISPSGQDEHQDMA